MLNSNTDDSRARPTAAALLAAFVLLACAAATRASVDASRDRQDHRLDGEYGLHVGISGDTLRVGWLTRAHDRGVIEVHSSGRLIFADTTGENLAHDVRFADPLSSEPLRLRFGALNDAADRHETVVRARNEKRPPVSVEGVDSLFVIGDVHGEFDTLTAVLRNAGVIDEALRWSAGRSHLAVAGDMMDRGDDVTRVLWFLYGLESQAEAAGGRLHVVLGNHELMVMTGDLRYVSAKETHLARLHGVSDYARLYHPHGSLLGRWLTSKPGMVRIDDVLIAHGGVAKEWLSTTLTAFDDTLAAYTHDEAFRVWADTLVPLPLDSIAFERRTAFMWDPTSVFWYRGYASSDTLGGALRRVLRHYDAALHVVGHTPGETVRSAYEGDLVLTNTAPFGRELLLLVRRADGWARFRVGTAGPPIPL